MTAVMTIATIAGPIGFLAAGEALRYVSLAVMFLAIAGLLTLGGFAFAAVLLRGARQARVLRRGASRWRRSRRARRARSPSVATQKRGPMWAHSASVSSTARPG